MLKAQSQDCCNVGTEPYVPPSLKDDVHFRIQRLASEIEQQNKILIFLEKFPEAAKYLNENGLFIYVR